VQQIESEEQAFPTPEQQVIEDGPAGVINASDFAIDNGILDMQVLTDPLRGVLEVAEGVPVAGDEITPAVLQIGECPETIDLQFVNE
jgi:hypothetical protein